MLEINIARNGDPSTNKCGVAVPFVVAVVDGVAVLFVVVDDVVVMLAGDDDDDEDDDDDDDDDDATLGFSITEDVRAICRPCRWPTDASIGCTDKRARMTSSSCVWKSKRIITLQNLFRSYAKRWGDHYRKKSTTFFLVAP